MPGDDGGKDVVKSAAEVPEELRKELTEALYAEAKGGPTIQWNKAEPSEQGCHLQWTVGRRNVSLFTGGLEGVRACRTCTGTAGSTAKPRPCALLKHGHDVG
jgi:hypothetical protein